MIKQSSLIHFTIQPLRIVVLEMDDRVLVHLVESIAINPAEDRAMITTPVAAETNHTAVVHLLPITTSIVTSPAIQH